MGSIAQHGVGVYYSVGLGGDGIVHDHDDSDKQTRSIFWGAKWINKFLYAEDTTISSSVFSFIIIRTSFL